MCLLCGISVADLDVGEWRSWCKPTAIYAALMRLVQQPLSFCGKGRKLTDNEIIELDRPDRPRGAGLAGPAGGGLA